MYIEKIKLENFKSFRALELPLSRFNILIGPNSSGKSTILQSLLILKNSLKNTQTHRLTFREESYDFGDFKDIISLANESQELTIGIIASKVLPSYLDDLRKEEASFGYLVTEGKDGISKIYFGTTMGDHEITFDWNAKEGVRVNYRNKYNKSETPLTLAGEQEGPNIRIRSSGNKSIDRDINRLFSNSEFTKHLLDDFQYIPFYRSATKYGAKLVRVPDDLLSSKPEDLMSATLSKLSKDTKLLELVGNFIKQLTGKIIRTRNVDLPTASADQGVTLEFVKQGFSNAIVNEGTGPNQAILLLTILAGSPPGSVIAIDEPEIHLHPKAQSDLAKIIIEISKKDSKQFIFTTHSEHMLYPFLTNISGKKIGKHELSIYSFDQDMESNYSIIERLDVNENGQIKGGLKGFWEADIDIFSEFMRDKNG